jgi:hypothetical protein
MRLWIHWFKAVSYLKDACSRRKTFAWMVVALLGFCIRPDLAGVTSFIRAGFVRGALYKRLLDMFHSPALDIGKLTTLWVKLVSRLFKPATYQGYLLLVADGIKIPKEGRQMPAVKKLHQSSSDNSKPAYIMGHSCQAVGILVAGVAGKLVSIPLVSRIHEGVVWTNLRRFTLLDKLVELLRPIQKILDKKSILVADAYYASRKIIKPLLEEGNHLVTRVKSNAVAYEWAVPCTTNKRGRPKKYGDKIKLNRQWDRKSAFESAPSPVYGEEGVQIEYLALNLLWRPVGYEVKFVLVKHPKRGRIILMTTMISMDPIDVIEIYGYRFKIETGFKSAIHTLGAYAYHFWMRDMKPLKRNSGDQYMHREPAGYREAVKRKIGAYHRYIQLACIAQGLLIFLSVVHPALVWRRFGSWLRTMRTENAPSELVVATALRNTLPQFLLDYRGKHDLEKIIREKLDPNRLPGLRLSA